MTQDNMPTETFPLNQSEGNNTDDRSRKFLWYAVCVACLLQLTNGAAGVWTSHVLPKLKDPNSTDNPLQRQITSYEEGLITSIQLVGVGSGPLIFSRTADLLGRKWFLISVSITDFCSFVLLAFAKHIHVFYFCRLIQGFCMGCSIVLPIFISEISENHNRGKLVTVYNVFLCLGNVYGYTCGSFLQFQSFTLICSLPLIINIPLFVFFIPESPFYLIMRGRTNQAKQALKKFRNLNNCEAEKVLSETKEFIHKMPAAESMVLLLKNRGFRRSMIITLGLFSFLPFSGIYVILEYLHVILSLANIQFSKNLISIVVSVIQTFSVLLGTVLIDKLGRKLLQLLSAIAVAISLFVIGIYFQLKASNYFDTKHITWLPVLAILCFILAYGAGLATVCCVLVSEVFPSEYRVRGCILSMITLGVAGFLVLLCFPLIRDSLGIAWCFWILGISTLLNMLFTHFYVIETKNKSFLEIQSLLEKRINYRKHNCS